MTHRPRMSKDGEGTKRIKKGGHWSIGDWCASEFACHNNATFFDKYF